MIAGVFAGSWRRSGIVLGLSFLTSIAAQAASPTDCPGHPDALGTSRTLVVDPSEHPRIGTMQYSETLPLADHEVVLTFDDGPLPKYSNQILDILASQCVKATFFTIGRQANANPQGVRKLVAAGHTVGTHSQNHPLTFEKMPIEKARQEIDDGIASTLAALGDPTNLAPLFRIPGLLRAGGVEEYLASRGIQVWSADFPADDWRKIPPSRVYDLAIKRLEAKGKGILLLHDIQPRTVAALPRILNELKARGYRIVHVVPATPDRPATPTDPQQWLLHPPSETIAISRWPKIPSFVFAETTELPAPVLSDLDWRDAELIEHARRTHGIPLPQRAPWQQPQLAQISTLPALPIPGASVFKIPEAMRVTLLANNVPANRPEQTASAQPEIEPLPASAKSRGASSRRAMRLGHAAHQNAHAGRGGRAVSKHAASRGNGRSVRVAGLKKR